MPYAIFIPFHVPGIVVFHPVDCSNTYAQQLDDTPENADYTTVEGALP